MLGTFKPIYSHRMQRHHSFYNNTHVGNCFTGLCTECTGYHNHLVIAAHCSGTSGVVVKSLTVDCNSSKGHFYYGLTCLTDSNFFV